MQLSELKQKIREELKTNKDFEDLYNDFLNGYGSPKLDGKVMKKISSERHNSDYTTIFSYDEKFYMIVGYYDSWNGVDFDDKVGSIKEVKPEQKTITVYKPIKGD